MKVAKDKTQQACHLGGQIPKLGRKPNRDYRPQSSVETVDTHGKPKIHGNGKKKETSETEWSNAFLRNTYENVHSLGNKWEEPENVVAQL
ncbi:hypothetical protein BTVI_13968 [Pitangus sulphuratus]|nr:hypothetical protein BTVI_13968 [Pitangus sulphuratus]